MAEIKYRACRDTGVFDCVYQLRVMPGSETRNSDGWQSCKIDRVNIIAKERVERGPLRDDAGRAERDAALMGGYLQKIDRE